MSGYPYGYSTGGYPQQYVSDNSGYSNYPVNSGFQPPPPSIPIISNIETFPPSHGVTAPSMPINSNFTLPPGNLYDYGSNINYQQPPPGAGFGNSSYQPPYPQVTPSPFSGALYPNYVDNSGAAATASASQFQYQQQPSILLASLEQCQGTIIPASNFNVEADCQALNQAMKGIGTNEKALIDIIVNRSNAQRQQIKGHYKSMFGMDLVKKIAGETSGHFKETVTGLFETPSDFDAGSLHQALLAGREEALSEILLTRTNSEIRAIVESYKRTFNKDLEKEVNKYVRGTHFKRILISAIQANRDELNSQQIQQARQVGIESIIDRHRARQDADALYKAGAGKLGTDEKAFNAIFSTRNYYQLRAIFEEYQTKYKQDIVKVIRSEFSGDIKDAYLVLITCIRDRPSFFAERIYKAIEGLGTKDSTLIRVIITRSEIDLVQIKERYQRLYNRSLAQDVSGDTSGDYKHILLSIIK